MKVQNKNNSSLKTKKLIKNTFIELVNEKKSLNNISVTDLVKKASINRSTFYTHYDNIYDVAKDLESETINLLIDDDDDINDIEKYFDKVVFFLKQNENTYQILLSSNEPHLFLNKLNKLLNKKLKTFLRFNNISYSDLTINFFVDGLMIQVLKYFQTGIFSLDEINKMAKTWFKLLFKNK